MTLLRSYLSYLVVLVICVGYISCQGEESLVDTGEDSLGKIQGSHAWSSTAANKVGQKYHWFTGIPYADPKSYTGANRFKPSQLWTGPLPVNKNTGSFLADENNLSIHCPQKTLITFPTTAETLQRNGNISQDPSVYFDPYNLIKTYYSREGQQARVQDIDKEWGIEECLVLTISTPKIPQANGNNSLLPVIFFIHGGGFDQFWGNVFGGQRLLNHDVVLVSINYRLGSLGALNLGIEDAPGNQAVYDCITALRWVQEYIHHFGGDKNKVTVSGQSAGAVLATTVFLSPLAKGLFHGAIGDSGSALSVWANQKNPIRENLKVLEYTSCKNQVPPGSIERGDLTEEEALALLQCVKDLPLVDLVNARSRYGSSENYDGRLGYDAFTPCIQKASLAEKIPLVLTESPAEVVKHGRQSDVPLMMGACRHDGSFVMVSTFYNYMVARGLDSDVAFIKNDLMAAFLKGVGVKDPSKAMMHALAKAYLGPAANSDEILSKFPGLLDLHTTIGFKAGAYGLVEAHSKLNPNSYYYAFDYQGAFTTFNIGFGTHQISGGIAHVDDLIYLFLILPHTNDQDWAVSDRYVKYWVNFATYGNPNGPGNLDEPFPKYNPVDHRFLTINQTDKMNFHCRDTWYNNSLELNWLN